MDRLFMKYVAICLLRRIACFTVEMDIGMDKLYSGYLFLLSKTRIIISNLQDSWR